MKNFLRIPLHDMSTGLLVQAGLPVDDDVVLPGLQVWDQNSIFVPQGARDSRSTAPHFLPAALWRRQDAAKESRVRTDGSTETAVVNGKILCNENSPDSVTVIHKSLSSDVSKQFQQKLYEGITPQTISSSYAYDRKAVLVNLAKINFSELLANATEGEYAIKGYASGDAVRSVSLSSCNERDQKQKFQIRFKISGSGADQKIYVTDLFGIGVMSFMPALAKNPTLNWIEARRENPQVWQEAANGVVANLMFRSWGSAPKNHSWEIIQIQDVLKHLESADWIQAIKQNPIFKALIKSNDEHRFRLSFRKERSDVKSLAITDPNEPITADNIGFVFSLYRDSNGILRLRVVDVEKNERSRNGFEHEAVALAKNPDVDWAGTAKTYKSTWQIFVKLAVEEEFFLNHIGVHRKDGGFAVEVTRADFLAKLRESNWIQSLDRYACLQVVDMQLGQILIMTSCYRNESYVGQLGLSVVKREDWKALSEITSQVKFRISNDKGNFEMELIANQGRCSSEIFDVMNESVSVNWERARALDPNMALDRANDILKQLLRKHTHDAEQGCVISRLADPAWINELSEFDLFQGKSSWLDQDFVIRIYRHEDGHDALDVIPAADFESIKTNKDRAFVRLRFMRDAEGELKFALRDTLGNSRREVMYALATNPAFSIHQSFDSQKQIRDFIALMMEEVLLHRQMRLAPISMGWENIMGRNKFFADLSRRSWLVELGRVTGLVKYLEDTSMLFVFGMNLDGDKIGMLSVTQPTNRVWEYVGDNKAQVLFALSHDGKKFGLTRWDQKGYNSELIGRRLIPQTFDPYGGLERFNKSSSGPSLFTVYHHIFGGAEEVFKIYRGLLGEEKFAELGWVLPRKKPDLKK